MGRRDWYEFAAQLICTAGSVVLALRILGRGRTHASRKG